MNNLIQIEIQDYRSFYLTSSILHLYSSIVRILVFKNTGDDRIIITYTLFLYSTLYLRLAILWLQYPWEKLKFFLRISSLSPLTFKNIYTTSAQTEYSQCILLSLLTLFTQSSPIPSVSCSPSINVSSNFVWSLFRSRSFSKDSWEQYCDFLRVNSLSAPFILQSHFL